MADLFAHVTNAALYARLAGRTHRHETGCWLFVGCLNQDGYAVVCVGGRVLGAHRLMYRLAVGDIGAKLEVCHRCDVRSCLNPEHLFLGDHKANMSDAKQKGRHRNGNMVKTHCKNGHVLAGPNLMPRKGRRWCRTCHTQWRRDKVIARGGRPHFGARKALPIEVTPATAVPSCVPRIPNPAGFTARSHVASEAV